MSKSFYHLVEMGPGEFQAMLDLLQGVTQSQKPSVSACCAAYMAAVTLRKLRAEFEAWIEDHCRQP